MLSEPLEHDEPGPRGRHFWSVTVESDEAIREIREWLARGKMTDRVEIRERRGNRGWFTGYTLIIDKKHSGILTALQMRFAR